MKKLAIAALVATTAFTSVPALAQTTYNDLTAWQSAVGSFNRDTDYGDEFSDIGGVTLDDGTVLNFSQASNIRVIGSSWATWSGGYTGQVLYTNGANSQTISFGSAIQALGFFVEPDSFGIFDFTLTLSDGSTIGASYDGSGGAGFLGFTGMGITGLTVTTTDTDFAFGDFYTAAGLDGVPEPATWAMMIGGFGVVGGAMRRRSAKVAYA